MKNILILLCLVLPGCAINSGIVSIGKDTYMVSRQAATGFSGSGKLKAKAFQEANKFCEKQGKQLRVVSTSEAKPPYLFANFPKAEVQFMCLDANDPQLQPLGLQKYPDIVIKREETVRTNAGINIKEEINKSPDLYTELIKLEDLRKKNILTEEEFQNQKEILLEKEKLKN